MLNPAFIFISMWSLVLVLYSLGLTSNLVSPSAIGVLVILMNMVSILLVVVLIHGRNKVEVPSQERVELYLVIVRRFIRYLFVIWLIGTSFEIYYSGGVPLYWRLAGINKLYTEFGVPSLHGVMNACYLQVLSMA